MLTLVGRILALLGVVWCTIGVIHNTIWLMALGAGFIGVSSALLEIGRERELKGHIGGNYGL